MRRVSLTPWIAVLLASLTAGIVAAYCPGADFTSANYDPRYYSIPKELARSRFVVRARVLDEIWLGEDGKPQALEPPFQFDNPRPWGFDPYIGAFYDVEVLEVFKGAPRSRLRLFSENSTARFWLEVKSELVLFIDEWEFEAGVGRQLTIDNCGNSALVTREPATLDAVRKLRR